MCGRFVITSAPEALRQAFGYADQPNFPARFNVAPTQPVPVIILDNGVRRFRLMRWGLVPSWVKDPRGFTLLINARAETVREKPAFRNAVKRRRVIVPADGYYEWLRASQPKQPFFISRVDGAPLAFAALSETWSGPNGEEVDSVAIVTTTSDAKMAALHDRVPVSLSSHDVARWLNCGDVPVDEACALLMPPREGTMCWHPVSIRVNRVANDDAQLVLPVALDAVAPESEKSTRASRRPAEVREDSGQGSLF